MEEADAKECFKNEVVGGSISENEPWIFGKKFVTTNETTITSILRRATKEEAGKDSSVWRRLQKVYEFYNDETKELLYKEVGINDDEYVTIDKHGAFLRLVRQERLTGLNGYYLYRKTPAFDGQAASLEYQVPGDGTNVTELYCYARFIYIPEPEEEDVAASVVYSVVKGADSDAPESGLGFAWKDIYKIIRIPQFQFAGIGFDTDKKMILKTKQQSKMKVAPVFSLGAGVDILSALIACFPLFPDGTQTWENAEEILDIASLFGFGF